MIGRAWFIARRDLRLILWGREAVLWTFVMPIVFFYFIGTVTSGFGGGSGGGEKPGMLVEVPGDAGFLADEIVRRVEEAGFVVTRASGAEGEDAASRRIVVPADFTAQVLAGNEQVVRFIRSSGGMQKDYDQVRLTRAVYTVLADVVAASEARAAAGPAAFAKLREHPRALTLSVKPAGERKRIPSGFEQAIPGIMVMFTLIVLLTGGVVMLVIERQEGLLRRLASAPLTRGEILLGKWIARMGLGIVQVSFGMLAGTLIFGMDWGPDLWMILVVLLSWAAFCASLGLLLGSFVRTPGQAIAIGVLASNVLAALGGCWWPIEITPQFMQTLAKFLPTGQAMNAMHDLISFRSGPASALPEVAILASGALVLGWWGARRFRFQ